MFYSGGVLGFRVVPRRVRIALTGHVQREIIRRTLQGAFRSGGAGLQILVIHRASRKIMIALDDDRIVGFGNDLVIPDGFHGFDS